MATPSSPRDANRIPAIVGASSTGDGSVVIGYIDPTTHRQLVDATIGAATISAGTVSIGPGSSTIGTVTVGSLSAGSNTVGSVTVTNFPASQTVSGTVGIGTGSNTIGTVTINSLPAVVNAAGSNLIGTVTVNSLPTVTVGTLPALVASSATIGSVTVTNFPATQAVSGTVGIGTGSNTIGTVTVNSLPNVTLATGSNTIGTVTVLPHALTAGNATIGTVSITNALPAGGNTLGTVTVNSLPNVTLNALPTGSNTIGTVTVGSLPSVTVGTLPATPAGSNTIGTVSITPLPTGSNTFGSVTVLVGTAATSLGKAEDAAHVSGDTGVASWGVRNDAQTTLTSNDGDYSVQAVDGAGNSMTVGNIANATADAGNPVKIGGVGKTANPTAVTDGQRVNALFDKLGKQITVGAVRDLKAPQFTIINNSTAETTVITAIASTFADVYGCLVTNNAAAVNKVTFKDSTAGTTRFTVEVPATDTRGFMLPVDSAIPQATVNNNWTATCGTSGSVEVAMFYVKNI